MRGEEVTLQFHAIQKGQASIIVADMMGNQLIRQVIEVRNGAQEVILKTQSLKTGLYIVKMIQNGKIATKKLVVH